MGNANSNSAGTRTVREVQQTFAEFLGFEEEIIWDHLSQDESGKLINKLKELIRDPQPPGEGSQEDEKKRLKIIADNERARQTIFNAVWEQRKYTNRQSLTAIIYVMVVVGLEDVTGAEHSHAFSCHPVFRARRCINSSSGNGSDSSDCCNIFVDEKGRVYQNWAEYVATNELPAGVMVAPERGLYRLVRRQVRLDKYVTPAGSTNSKVLAYLDTGSAIGGFAAACIPVTAGLLTLPVSVPLMAIAGVVGLASAGYATARASVKLVDRSQHEQSISVADREARGHWLGVTVGAVGLGAVGATQAVAAATNAGREVGAIAQVTVNGMNISSIVISGTGVANGVLDLILKMKDGDDISAMDMLQLSASLVLFTHSVYNFKLASTIINEAAASRDTLSNRLRRAFDKASRETSRLLGNTGGKLDIIRTVDEVPNDLYSKNQEGGGNASGAFLELGFVIVRGVRFVLENYGGTIFEHVINAESFENLISSMAHTLKPDVFDLVMNLTMTFMDTMLDELTSVLKFYISTESVLFRILDQVKTRFWHMSCKELDMRTGDIFTAVKLYFMSLNPNSNLGLFKKCKVCGGHFKITPL